MKTSSGLKGAVVLSLALSLALPGGAWAKARPQGSEPVTGAQTGKPSTPPAACQAEGPIAVCAPQAAPKKTKPPAKPAPAAGTAK